MLKNEKGITLIALVITVIIMLILITATIQYGSTSISEVKLQNFSYEMQQVQGRVDNIYQRMIMEKDTNYASVNGKTIGVNVNYSKEATDLLKELTLGTIDYNDPPKKEDSNYNQYFTEPGVAVYRYLAKEEVESQLDIKNPKHDVIINFKKREVISVDGVVHNEVEYHRLSEVAMWLP